MLAVQVIKLRWFKDSRNAGASAKRQQLLEPQKLRCSNLSGDGLFININEYDQIDSAIIPCAQLARQNLNASYKNNNLRDSSFHRDMLRINLRQTENEGRFYDSFDDPHLDSVKIIPEDSKYRVMWHSRNKGSGFVPVRRGRNEEFRKRSSEFSGSSLVNETAFILGPGESGRMKYNYRYVSYEGIHYELYCLFFVNTDKLTPYTFTDSKYKYDYEQMAYLF